MHFSILTHLVFPQSFASDNFQLEHPDSTLTHGLFEKTMMHQIDEMMKPYDGNTENSEYLEFEDMSESLREDYHKRGLDVVRLSNGSIRRTYDQWFRDNFVIENGVVFQRRWGPLHHPKRSKKAKRMQLLESYPFDKFYPSIEAFAEEWHGYRYDESYQAYGYYSNPNGRYDWYQVGGRWPDRLLIAAEDPFYVSAERSWAVKDEEKKAPDGYRWVTGARKSTIQWDLMKSWAIERATALFGKLEQWFSTGTKPEDLDDCFYLIEDNIVYWGDIVRNKSTTLAQFLQERGLAPEQRFLLGSFYIINEGSWECQDSYPDESDEGNKRISWGQYMEQYLDGLPDDALIVTLDIHG